VVGSLNVDLAVHTQRLPRPGETLLATSLQRSGGGKGANQAVAAARAGGARTRMVGAVGADTDGDALLTALAADAIDVSGVRRVEGVPTGLALITIDATAENTIVVVTGANAATSLSEKDRLALSEADVVLAQLEVPQPIVAEAGRSRRPGSLFILNAAPSGRLLPELAGVVDLLVVNEPEATDLAGEQSLETALRRLLALVPAVLVTLGADGARLVRSDGTDLHVPAPRTTPVDTVAAGDTFCGVYAAAVATGLDDRSAIQRACAAASLAIRRSGAQSSIPTVEETVRHAEAVYG
jgi:ribokinase